MAENIKIGIDVDDNGSTKKLIASAETLKKTYDGAAASAESITKKLAPVKATMAPKTTSALNQASMSSNDLLQYNQAKGIAGATGASSRDFAAQAQGLGGLVHVYATFAANLFAVSAAFNVLKSAADTTNMVKGLDQLGASSGRNLGTLSKRIAELSDGAVNLREAMTATAQATAAGMSSKNLERLTVVAKTASQALGIDMGDALSRLSRGVTKLEPELLDELGIFVKIDEATSTYARQIGKTATSLTDFEKRQAFANAVLEEGERKFAAIKLDANPYNKILAAMQNLAQSGLELINKVFTPILSILTESPTALATAMAGIGIVLLKQAIPAIGMFRENARLMAAETHERLKKQLQDQQEYALRSDAVVQANAEKEYLAQKTVSKKIEEIQESRFNKQVLGSRVRGLLTKSPFDLTNQEMNEIAKKHESLANKIAAGNASADEKLQHDKLSKRESRINAIREEAKEAGFAAQQAHEQSDEKWYSHQTLMRKKQQAMERAETKANVLAMAADNAAIYGPSFAFKQLGEDVKKADLSKLGKTLTYVQGAASIATTYISNLLNVYGMYVAIATAAFAILDSLLSNNSKEAEKYSKAIDTVAESFDNVARTMDVIASKKPFDVLSIESIQARATAFNELSTAATGSVTSFTELQKASQGWWDKSKDAVLDMFGKGSADMLATSLAKSISSGISLMQEGPAKNAAKEKFRNIVGGAVDVTSFKNIEKALRELTDADITEKGKQVSEALSEISREANNTASNLTSLKTSFAETSKVVQTSIAELAPKDVFGKAGASLVSNSISISDAIKAGPIESLNVLNELIKNNEMLSLLPKDTVTELQKAKKELDGITERLGGTEKTRVNVEKQLQALKDTGKYISVSSDAGGNTVEALSDEAERLESVMFALEQTRKNLTKSAQDATANFAELDKVVFKAGIDRLTISLKGAFEEGGLIAAKGYLSVLKGVGGETAAEEGKIRAREISIQMENIKATYSHITAIQENTRALTEKTAKDDLAQATEGLKTATGSATIDRYTAQQTDAQRRLDIIAEERRLTKAGSGGIRGAMSTEAKTPGSLSDITKDALKNLAPVIAQMFTMEGQLAKLVGQATANELQTMAATLTEAAQSTKRSLDQATAQNNIELDSINNVIAISSMYDEILYTKKNELEISNQLNTYLAEYAAINAKVLITEELLQSMAKGRTEAQLKDNKQYQDTVKAKEKNEKDLDTLVTSNVLKLGRLQTKQALDQITAQQTTANALLDTYRTLGGISEKDYINSKLKLDNDKETAKVAAAVADLRESSAAKIAQAEAKGDTVGVEKLKKDSTEAITRLEAQRDKQLELNKAIADQKISLDTVKSATESLSEVFGTLGTNIGNVVGTLTSYATSSKAMSDRHRDSFKGMEKDSDQYKDQEKKNAKERAKFDLDANISILSSSKKLFSEKTAAYKIISGVEKAMHVYKLAMWAKEAAMELWATGQSVLNSGTRTAAAVVEAGVNGVAAVVKAIASLPFPLNLAAGAATAAVVSALLSSIGGSSVGVSGGAQMPTGSVAEGTGTVLGDPTAKSESVSKSIEALKDVDVITMQHSGNMVKYLRNIDSNIGQLGTSLFRVMGVSDNIAQTKLGAVNESWINYTGFTQLDKVITNLVGQIPIVGGAINKIGNAFGFGSTSSVTGQGILINPQSLKDITKGVLSASYYADVSSSSKALGITYKSSSSTQVTPVEKEVNIQLTRVFQGMVGSVKEAALALGKDIAPINTAIESYIVDIGKVSLSGLSSDKVLEKLNAVFSAVTDKLAEAIMPGLEDFVKVGSGYSEALFRVAAGVEEANAALLTLNKTAISYTEIINKQGDVAAEIVRQSIIASETQSLIKEVISNFDGTSKDIIDVYTQLDTLRDSLIALGVSEDALSRANITAAGGLEKFTSGINKLVGSFTSGSVKISIDLAKSVEVFSGLGIEIPKTREALMFLLESLAKTAPQAAASVLSIIDTLDTLYTGLEELAAKRTALSINIANLTGDTVGALALTRQETLKATDPALRAAQEYIFALEDVKSAQDALTAARKAEGDSLNSTINGLKNYIDSLRKFRDSLLLGAQSTLTPEQKYLESKKQFDAILATATGAASTPAEIAAKNAALDQLQGASTAFLDASRIYNASSAQYTEDFSLVQKALTATSDTLASQLSDSEKQLSALNLINDSVLTVAQAIEKLAQAQGVASSLQPAASAALMTPQERASSTGGFIENGIVYGASGGATTSVAEGAKAIRDYITSRGMTSELYDIITKIWKLDSTEVAQILGVTQSDVLSYVQSYGFPAFAKGTNYVPNDMLAEIHQGERIIPAADNVQLMQSLGDRNETNRVLVEEIRNLRNEVKELRDQQAKETGNIIIANLDAQQRNAEHIGEAINSSAQQTSWNTKVKDAVKLK